MLNLGNTLAAFGSDSLTGRVPGHLAGVTVVSTSSSERRAPGKSSLLKAGIIPRLRREAPAWLPLRVFRPGADPLLNFAEALARTYADFGKSEAHGVMRDRLMDAWSKAERGVAGELTKAGVATLERSLEAEGNGLRLSCSSIRSARQRP